MGIFFSKIVSVPFFHKNKTIVKKINALPLAHVFFLILIFFLPFQNRHHSTIKWLSNWAFQKEIISPFFFDRKLSFYLGDILTLFLAIFTFSSSEGRWRQLLWSRSQKYLTAFLCITLISVIASQSGGSFWPYYRFLQHFLPLMSCLFLFQTPDREGLITIVFWVLLFTGIVQVFVAIDQYILQEAVGLTKLGEPNIHYQSSANFYIESRIRWIFDRWLGKSHSSFLVLRPYGTFIHPNVLGAFLGMTTLASAFLFLTAKRKILVGGAILFQIFALFLTYSRGAIFGLLGGGFLMVLLFFSQKQWRKPALHLSLIFLLGGALSMGILYEQFLARGGVVNYAGPAKDSDRGRLRYQATAFQMAKEKPFFGHGLNQFEQQLPRFVDPNSGEEVQCVHNVYLLILTEMGALGLTAFIGFFLSLFYWTLRKGLDPISITLVAILVYFLWFCCVDHLMFTRYAARLMFFLMISLLSSHVLGPVFSRQPAGNTSQ